MSIEIPINQVNSLPKALHKDLVGAEVRLMRRLANGDEHALKELIERHGPMLQRLIGRLVAWNDEQDDILQEVLLIVWQKASSFNGSGCLEGWLKRIAINRCHNFRRKQSTLAALIESVKHLLARDTVSHTSRMEVNEITQTGLARLNPHDRTLIVLFYLEEMPGHEIANTLETRVETLHVRLHRARVRLKTIIESLESGDE